MTDREPSQVLATEASQVKNYKQKRAVIKGRLTRFKQYVEELSISEYSVDEAKCRLAQEESLYKEFDEYQSKLEALQGDPDWERERQEFEVKYYSAIGLAYRHIRQFERQFAQPNNTQQVPQNVIQQTSTDHTRVNLPKIDLPNFDGKHEDWLPFKEMFISLVHASTSLGAVQKFHYLRLAVKGPAAKLIDTLSLTTENYEIAWNLLNERYQNNKVILQHLLQSIVEYEKIPRESSKSLMDLLDHFKRQVRSIESITQDSLRWDYILVYLMLSKLDSTTLKAWNLESSSHQPDTFADFCAFLQKRGQALESLSKETTCKLKPSSFKQVYNKPSTSRSFVVNANNACLLCNEEHLLFRCPRFANMNNQQRWNTVSNNKLCSNCLRGNHSLSDCQSTNCFTCHKRHHTMLHQERQPVSNGTSHNSCHSSHKQQSSYRTPTKQRAERREQPTASTPNTTGTAFANNAQANSNIHTFLATAQVLVKARDGKFHKARALLDSGATHTFITKDLVDRLQLPTKETSVAVTGVNLHTSNVLQTSNFQLRDAYGQGYKRHMQCLVIEQIANDIPSAPIDVRALQIPEDIILADTEFNIPAHIDILLGADIFWNLITGRTITVYNQHHLKASLRETRLGWILAGQINCQKPKQQTATCHISITERIHKQMEKFWEMEETATPPRSQEDEECEKLFTETIQRTDTGRYMVTLPFKAPTTSLGTSRDGALKRFFSTESRLLKNTEIHLQYADFMSQYEELGHMEPIHQGYYEDGPHAYYIPHQHVIKDDSTTTKLRVVFNASYKTSSGLSLNDLLYTGPCVQPDLYTTLIRFRCHPYVLNADIEKMYRMILLQPQQRSYQRIFWRYNKNEPVKIFQLATVTYGQACSAYAATRVLNKLAEDEKERYPRAAKILSNQFYVDDLLATFSTEQEAIDVAQELTQLLHTGGFNLTKFCSNSDSVLQTIPSNKRSTESITKLEDDDTVKTLGLQWNPKIDALQYSVRKLPTAKTKRQILSAICTLFDPQGLISPIIASAKRIMQQIWLCNIGWDEEAPEHIRQAWENLNNQLPEIQSYRIPRNVLSSHYSKLELHIFCDASPTTYGAACYVKSTGSKRYNHIQLLTSKSKVAPLKEITLPRLELCAAVLAAQLYAKIKSALTVDISHVHFWTDSLITLQWVTQEPHKWSNFVAHRVTKIQQLTKDCIWSYVPTQHNPADIITRPTTPYKLKNNHLWWNGPEFLKLDQDQEPTIHITTPTEELSELKASAKALVVTKPQENLLNKYSTFSRLNKIVAYCLRFKHNCLNKNDKLTGPLTLTEIQASHDVILRQLQQEAFGQEIAHLKQKNHVDRCSPLLPLHPFLDSTGLLRVGGRIQRSDLSYDSKHQILLPSKHHLTALIIRDLHAKNLHEGPQGLLYTVRQRYWPIRGVQTVKLALKGCLICFRHHPLSSKQIMGNLPEHRVTKRRAFEATAVDYVGPLTLKPVSGRSRTTYKAYVCMYVCLATKAVHIELVTSASSEAFIASFQRFASRRGLPAHLYLDNGRNFVGAEAELKRLYDIFKSEIVQQEILQYTTSMGTDFHFLPPRASHMAGLVERSNRSMKTLLYKTMRNTVYSYEECYTALCKIEAIINSRPLTPMSSDISDLSALSPGHFLIGAPLNSIPSPSLKITPDSRLSRYQLIEKQTQHIWDRWSKEYLNTLQQRQKWQIEQPNVRVGDLVIMKVDNAPPLVWPMARILEVYPGPDGSVRVVTLKTANSELKRPISKICLLPLQENFLVSGCPPSM